MKIISTINKFINTNKFFNFRDFVKKSPIFKNGCSIFYLYLNFHDLFNKVLYTIMLIKLKDK
jgi:hypothetical protein